jgi:hypothetical protein
MPLTLSSTPSALLFFYKIHDQVAAFHLRRPLRFGNIGEQLDHPLQHRLAEFLMNHLAPAKRQRDFDFIAFFDKLARMLRLEFEVVLFDFWAKPNLLDVNDGGFFAAVLFLFTLFVLELAVVDDPANGRLGSGCDFDEIKPDVVSA